MSRTGACSGDCQCFVQYGSLAKENPIVKVSFQNDKKILDKTHYFFTADTEKLDHWMAR
jgi:hypothetical protein